MSLMPEDTDTSENRSPEDIDHEEKIRQMELDVPRTPEAVIRQEVKRLFNTEREVTELAAKYGVKNRKSNKFYVNNFESELVDIVLFDSEIKNEWDARGSDGVTVHFLYYLSGRSDNSELVGIKTPYHLAVGRYTDLETREKFIEYAQSAPSQGYPDTRYFFSEDGTYGKIQCMNSEFESGKKRLFDTGSIQAINSPMEPEDFELAQTALELIKIQLTPSTPPPSE